jgi:hypothetical protein
MVGFGQVATVEFWQSLQRQGQKRLRAKRAAAKFV